MKSRLSLVSARAVVPALLLGLTARADNGTWLGVSGNWGDTATWSGGTLAEGADFTANFTGVDITVNQTVTLEAPRTIGNITFTDATTSSHNLTLSGGGTLTLDRSSGMPVIDVTQSGRLLTIASVVDGLDGLRKNGAGTLVLSATNTYAGGTVLAAGVVTVPNPSGFGPGNVAVSGSARINVTGGNTHANNLNVGAALSLLYTGVSNGTTAFSGVLSGAGAITVVSSGLGSANAGTLGFNHPANTFTGNVIMPSSTGGSDIFRFASIGDGGNLTFARPSWREAVVYNGTTNMVFNVRQIAIASTVGTATGLDGNGNPVNMFQNNGTGAVTFNTDMAMPGSIATSTYFAFGGSNAGSNTFAGVIGAPGGANTLGILKWDAGKWILANPNNAFTGHAWIANGTLSVPSVANAGDNQPLGKGARILLGQGTANGVLEITGASASGTDKQVQIGNSTATNAGAGSIVNNGSGTVTFTNPVFNPAITGITVARTLTLSGTSTGANRIEGTIQNNAAGGAVNIAKTGRGTWVLAGANTFTGTVQITGTATSNSLRLEHNEALGPAATAKTVTLTGSNRQVATVELANNITVDINKVISTSGKSFMAAGETTFGSPVFLRNVSGDNKWLGNVIIGTAGGAYSIETVAGTLTLGDPGTASVLRNDVAASTRTFDFRGAGDVVVNARIANNGTAATGLNKYGTGTLMLPRTDNDGTFTTPNFAAGTTVVENLTDGGTPSSIGAGASFNFGGTFRHAGAADSVCNRAFGLVGASPALESSGAGALALTSATPVNLIAAAGTTVAAFTNGATVLTGIDVQNLLPGMVLTGSNIVAGTRITAIDYDARRFTIDTPATAAQTTHLAVTFSGAGEVDRTFTLGGANAGDNRINAPIPDPAGAGKLGLIKTGAGSWTLAGASTYQGPTTVLEGSLRINGSLGGTGAVSVASAAILGGSGTIAGPVTVQAGGQLEPGSGGIGQLTLSGNLDVQGTLAIETNGTTNDLVRGVAQLALGPASVLDLSGTLVAASQVIARYTTRSGTFADISDVTAQGYEVVYDDLAGEIRLQTLPATLTVPATPAPGLSWPTRVGRFYTLQYRPELDGGDWTDVPGYIDVPGTGGLLALPALITADPRGYYRLSER